MARLWGEAADEEVNTWISRVKREEEGRGSTARASGPARGITDPPPESESRLTRSQTHWQASSSSHGPTQPRNQAGFRPSDHDAGGDWRRPGAASARHAVGRPSSRCCPARRAA